MKRLIDDDNHRLGKVVSVIFHEGSISMGHFTSYHRVGLEISGSKMMMKVHVLQPHLHFILQFLDLKQNSSSYF